MRQAIWIAVTCLSAFLKKLKCISNILIMKRFFHPFLLSRITSLYIIYRLTLNHVIWDGYLKKIYSDIDKEIHKKKEINQIQFTVIKYDSLKTLLPEKFLDCMVFFGRWAVCKEICFTTNWKNTTSHTILFGWSWLKVTESKYLGVNISNSLPWNHRTNSVCNKVNNNSVF